MRNVSVQELLSVPETDGGVLGARARSASDAAVLRRKGHLKEQDMLIEFMLSMHSTHTSLEVMQKMERWIVEHRQVWNILPSYRISYGLNISLRIDDKMVMVFGLCALAKLSCHLLLGHYNQRQEVRAGSKP